jgi:hypothetical protein
MCYLGEDYSLGHYAQYEWILAVGELARSLRALPVEVILHQIHVVQSRIVELCVTEQWWCAGIVCSI